MDTKIKKFLEKENIKHEVVEHRKVYTAFNAAETQHVKTNDVVKTVLVKLSNSDYILAAVPAGKRIDLKKIAKTLNDTVAKTYKLEVKKNPKAKKPKELTAKLAKENDIISKLKTKVGLISPFSQIYGLNLLFDKKLTKNKHLLVSAGSYTQSIKIKTADFLKHTESLQGVFTE